MLKIDNAIVKAKMTRELRRSSFYYDVRTSIVNEETQTHASPPHKAKQADKAADVYYFSYFIYLLSSQFLATINIIVVVIIKRVWNLTYFACIPVTLTTISITAFIFHEDIMCFFFYY